MPRRTREASEVIVARSKRTGEKYPARISHFAGYSDSHDPYLQYTENKRQQTCRGRKKPGHEERYLGCRDNQNVAIAQERDMKKFNLQSCVQTDLKKYYERKRIEWALRSVHAERFHYTNKAKNTVCRCFTSEHLSCRRVRNPEIQELCADYFLLEPKQTTCTRDQWRMVESAVLELPKEPAESHMNTVTRPLSRRLTSKSDPFGFDSPSVIDLLQVREARSLESRKHRSWPSAERKVEGSSDSENLAHPSSGKDAEVDIPQEVWRRSRPSVYLGQHNIESHMSTPIGSSATPVHHAGHPSSLEQQKRPSTLPVGAEANRLDRNAEEWVISGLSSPRKLATSPSRDSIGSCKTKIHVTGLGAILDETPPCLDPGQTAVPTHPVELPSLERASELEASLLQSSYPSHHSPTLRELESERFEYVAELTGRSSRNSSKASKASRRLTRIINQPLLDPNLPCQEDFFLQWIEVCSRDHPAPTGDCSLCNNSLQAPDKCTIQLPCGHYMHQECFVSHLRVLDFEYGNCPVCGMALCERTLYDRIDTDREAIFGQSFTNLRAEERIEFTQRTGDVICWSEEEVAAAQLRLLKDYVDSHADEVYRQWRQTGLEPDWGSAVVIPVVKLFKGWNVSTRRCRYFADRDSFYKLVAWAELVRLMNTTRDGIRKIYGPNAPFPQLSKLYRKLMLAKERYETKKKTWSTNHLGVFDCEVVAQDAFSLAVGSHFGNRL